MKSFKEFILEAEENEELYAALKNAEDGLDDAELIDKINDITGVNLDGLDGDEYKNARQEAMQRLQKAPNEKGDEESHSKMMQKKENSSSDESSEPEERDLETDINGLKNLFNSYKLAGKLDNILKYIDGLPKGNNKPQFFEKIVNTVNANCKESQDARDAKNAIIFYILLRALNKKVADKFTELKQQDGALSIFGGDIIGGGSLFKSFKNFKNEDVKNFLSTAFNFSSNFSNTIGVNANGSGNGSLLKLIEKCSKLDIDEDGLKTIEKEIDNFKAELHPVQSKAEPDSGNNSGSGNDSGNDGGNDGGSIGGNDGGNDSGSGDGSNGGNNDGSNISTNSTSSNEAKTVNDLNSETPKDQFEKIHKQIYGDDDNDLGGYYNKYKTEGLEAQKNQDNLHKETIRQKPVEESAVLDIINNKAYDGIISENIFRHLGRTNVSAENTENGPNGWKRCFEELKDIRSKAKTKADTLLNQIFKENTGINEKINLIQKYKHAAFEYRQKLSKTVSKFQKANSYNGFGKLAHDMKVSKNKALDKAEEAFKNSSSGKMLEVARKEISSHVDNLKADSFEKAFNDQYKPVVGHYFANYTNAAEINNKDENLNKSISKAAFDAILNAKDLFGIGNISELPLLAEKIIKYNGDNGDIEKIKAIIRDWDNNYKTNQAVNPIKDDLEYAKANPLANFTHLQVKQYCDAIKSGITTITNESVGSFMSYYYSKILKEELITEWPFNRNNQQNGQSGQNGQPAPIDKKLIRTFALYCLMSTKTTEDFKSACANYLIEQDKVQYTPEQYFKAVEAFRQKHANDASFTKSISQFDAVLGVYNNGNAASEEDTGTNNNASENPEVKPNNINNINNLSNQEEDSGTGARAYDAPDQDTDPDAGKPTPSKGTVNRAGQNVLNNMNARRAAERGYQNGTAINNNGYKNQDFSVVAEPQATVTTGAVGSYTIPDRLSKQLIRRKMKSRIDSAF